MIDAVRHPFNNMYIAYTSIFKILPTKIRSAKERGEAGKVRADDT